MVRWFVLCVLWLICGRSEGFSSGAPDKVCQQLLPVHQTNKLQETKSPFTVTATEFSGGGLPTQFWNVTITSNDGTPFKGFILQARYDIDSPRSGGSFHNVKGLQTRKCAESENYYLTHIDNSVKNTLTLGYESPAEFEGNIFFFGTVVKSFDTFWRVQSDPISIVKRDAEEGDNTGGTSGEFVPYFESEMYDGCGVDRKCIGSDPNCIYNRNCLALVTVRSRGKYEFEMFSKNENSKYVAVGLSNDMVMGGDGDSVLECVVTGQADQPIKAYRSFNLPNKKQNERLIDQVGFQLIEGKHENGIIYCKVHHDTIFEIDDRTYNLDRNAYYLLLAVGSKLRENSVGYHDIIFTRSEYESKLDDLKPPKKMNEIYTGCNSLKNCFGVPNGCIDQQDCQAVVSILVQGSNYEFELLGRTTGYIGVGLSEDPKMGGDSVTACLKDPENPNGIKLYSSWNAPNVKANTNEGVIQDAVNLLNSSFKNGEIYCKFNWKEKTTVKGKTFDLRTNEYFILLAAGSQTNGNNVGYHDIVFTSSAQKRLLSDVNAFYESSKLLLRLHGSFMIIAWIGCASMGIIIARYFKQTWVGDSFCGKDIWFTWHRFFMLLTWTLTICAFILIFIEIGEWVSGGSQLHAILGCVTTALAFIQPIGAAFRPAPNALNRPIFNWFHWFFGNSAYIFGTATIFLAVPLNKAEIPEWFNWLLVVHVALYVVTHLSLSMNICVGQKTAKRVDNIAMSDMHSNNSAHGIMQRSMDAPFSGLRKTTWLLFITVNIIYVVIMVLIVVLAPFEKRWQQLW